MDRTTTPRLFQPGAGASPPTLAGRDAQQAVLSRCLVDLVAGTAPPHDVVLLGPRGNGKTALLNWFKGVCDESYKTAAHLRAGAKPSIPVSARKAVDACSVRVSKRMPMASAMRVMPLKPAATKMASRS